MTRLGERLRFRRWEELRVLQQDVAAAAGISASRLSELEHDRHRVAEPTLRRLAVVLGLDPDELVDHARHEDRLADQLREHGDRTTVPVVPYPRPTPERVHPHVPDKPWLTTAEASAVLGNSVDVVIGMIRTGRLTPVRYLTGLPGRPRLLIATTAVASVVPRVDEHVRWSGWRPVPDGYVTMLAFITATGLSYGALHRRLETGVIASERIGRRRLIPVAELARWLTKPGEESAVIRAHPAKPAPAREQPRPYYDPRWEAALDDLPLDGIKATVIRARYGPEGLTRRAIGDRVGKTSPAILQHETAALRILRHPAFRAFSCGLPRDHPLRLAVFRMPGLEDELCGDVEAPSG